MRPTLECRATTQDLLRLLGGLLLAVCGGCADRTSETSDHSSETWDVIYVQGVKVGTSHTVEREVFEAGERQVRTELDFHLMFKRFGQTTTQDFKASSTETPQGDVLRFEYEMIMEPSPRRVRGVVVGNVLRMDSTIGGRTTSSELEWPTGTRGFFAIEQSLRRRPIQPGEQRSIRAMQPLVDQIADIRLVAGQYETTRLPSGNRTLLRVQMSQRFGSGIATKATYWVDRDGEVQRVLIEGMQMESFRTTREVALREGDSKVFDVGLDLLVKVDRPLAQAHDLRRAVYEVTLGGGDPAEVFASGISQQVEPTGEHTARIVVTAVRPDQRASDEPDGRLPTDEDRQPNSLIQSDDESVVAMAASVAVEEADPWRVAVALEDFVSRTVEVRDFSQVFASAAEVAASKQGDCTEHAVLLAALCRARKIPARVAMGLVYVEREQGFLYHMWTEAWIADRWIPLDGTLGRGGIGAAHLKLSDSNLAGSSAYSSLLPIINVVGRLKIKVLETQ